MWGTALSSNPLLAVSQHPLPEVTSSLCFMGGPALTDRDNIQIYNIICTCMATVSIVDSQIEHTLAEKCATSPFHLLDQTTIFLPQILYVPSNHSLIFNSGVHSSSSSVSHFFPIFFGFPAQKKETDDKV